MKNTAGLAFHNRFDIEIRDKETGKLKQRAEAENIILDQMYTRLCNLSTYFVNIHFGTGTGVPIPGRTTLFSHLGTKAAATEEIIKAYPVSKWTRYIRLEPSEYVGQSISEVGIAYGATNTNLVTHAMIKDAEGNSLTIEKTASDVILIYATVYITLSNSEHLVFSNMPSGNTLLNLLFHEGSQSNTLQVGSSSRASDSSKNSCACMLMSKAMTAAADVANKKRTWTSRLEVTEANHNVQELGLRYALRARLGNTPTWMDYQVSGIELVRLAGETNKFAIEHPRIQDLSIRVDGELTTNYLLEVQHVLDYPRVSLADICENFIGSGENYEAIHSVDSNFYSGTEERIQAGGKSNYAYVTMDVMEEYRTSLIGAVLETRIFGGGAGGPETRAVISVSYDGVSYIEIGYAVADLQTGSVTCQASALTAAPIKIRFAYNGNSDTSYGQVNWAMIRPVPPAVVEVFDEITESTLVTASYKVESVPKTENYVFDTTFEVQFGEGV